MNRRLLVVDDERGLAASMAEYFDARGYRVDVAHEREAAEALVDANAYDAVITDLRLTPTAEEEGLKILQFVRQRWPRTVMVVLTAFSSARSERLALAHGAAVVVHKPEPLADLERCVRTLVDEARALTP